MRHKFPIRTVSPTCQLVQERLVLTKQVRIARKPIIYSAHDRIAEIVVIQASLFVPSPAECSHIWASEFILTPEREELKNVSAQITITHNMRELFLYDLGSNWNSLVTDDIRDIEEYLVEQCR
jgi:hypothetical protein